MKILELYIKDRFTKEDEKRIEQAIENRGIETEDIIEDFKNWQQEKYNLSNEVLEYFIDFLEYYDNGKTHPQNYLSFIDFAMTETE